MHYIQAQIAADRICDTCGHSQGPGCRIFRSGCEHFGEAAAKTVNIDKCDTDPRADTVILFHIPVKKLLLDRYVHHIVQRLGDGDNDPAMRAYAHEQIFDITALEKERAELHIEILRDAGFEPFDMCPEAVAFRHAVEEYIEQRVKRFGLPRIYVVPKTVTSPTRQAGLGFARLKGLLKEYADDDVDSVELVNSVRGRYQGPEYGDKDESD